jgi:thioesterase domain-containing protein
LKHLDVEQPFFVVCHADPVRDKRLLSVEELAHGAVDAIRRLRPHGPYILGGHCYGGVVAFEAALQLMSQGEQIAHLVFFDVSTPGNAGVGDWRRYLTGARELVWALLRGQERLTVGAMAQHLRALGRAVRRRFGGRASRCLSALGSDALLAGRDLRTLNGMGMWEYTPRDFPAPIMHFIAADQPTTKLLSDRRLGWREFARAGLEVRKVRGDHNSMFAADNAEMLGDQLNASLPNGAAPESRSRQVDKHTGLTKSTPPQSRTPC